MNFKDYFSGQSKDYLKFRPDYPDSLFQFINNYLSGREIAWDCATGNGQAAMKLVNYFDRVIATDASKDQILNAYKHCKIEYRVMPSEETNLLNHSVDLVTVAQALHWFNFNTFFIEVHRVLKPFGIIAVWTYGLHKISPEIDKIILKLYSDILGSYWPIERKYVEENYKSIQFPFSNIIEKKFYIQKEWSLNHVLGYLFTWSATQKYIASNGTNPIELILHDLEKRWGERDSKKIIIWPIYLKIGIKI